MNKNNFYRINFFVTGGYNDPSPRTRGYAFATAMANLGLEIVFHWSYSFRFNYELSDSVKWGKNFIKDFVNKFAILLSSNQNDIFYIQRGFIRGLPSILRRFSSFIQILMIFLIKSLLRRKMIFDIDDALYLKTPFLIDILIRKSDFVIVGSHALYHYASNKNKRVYLIPTSIATRKMKKINKSDESIYKFLTNKKIIIGWLGSTSTIKNIQILADPINLLGLDYDIEFRVIGAKNKEEYGRYQKYFSEFNNVKLVLIPWFKDREQEELSLFDIGVAPLKQGPWEEGKCGFKLLMYMSLGIPCVASAVGENSFIIQDGHNGFLCKNTQEWIEKLQLLIENVDLRRTIGINGKKTIETRYDLGYNANRLVSLIQKILVENNI